VNTTRTFAALSLAALFAVGGVGCETPASAYKDRGDTYFGVRQDHAAIENYEHYLQLRSGDEAARFNLAQSYMRSQNPAKAADHLRILHTQNPRNTQYTEALAEALLVGGRRDELYRLLKSEALEQQTMQDWLRLGTYALRQGDKDTAKVALLASAKVDAGRSWQPHVALYDYYRSMGQRAEAVRRLRMAAWVAPLNAEVTRRIAEAGEVSGPTFALRPAEWDARVFDNPSEPFNPFEKAPATASGEGGQGGGDSQGDGNQP